MASSLLQSIRSFFFFNDTATTEIYTLSLHDALPIFDPAARNLFGGATPVFPNRVYKASLIGNTRSEEHTSELQSQFHLVCRLLLEKKKKPIVASNQIAMCPYVFNPSKLV